MESVSGLSEFDDTVESLSVCDSVVSEGVGVEAVCTASASASVSFASSSAA